MLTSLILAWVAVILLILSALKYITRVSGQKKLNRLFHKTHIPLAILLLIVGVLHGILAGNPAGATFASFQPAAVLFTPNFGTVCLILIVLLGFTYLFRRKLKKYWMPLHRLVTVLLLVSMILHIAAVGIQLPQRLFSYTDTYNMMETKEPLPVDGTPNSKLGTEENSNNESVSAQNPDASFDKASATESVVSFSGAVLKDGTYQGSANGYNGAITLSVVVASGAVTEISIVSQSETNRFFQQAKRLLDTILSQQSLEVDVVAGATFSSAGLINAVSDALQQAVESGTLKVNDVDVSSIQRHGKH